MITAINNAPGILTATIDGQVYSGIEYAETGGVVTIPGDTELHARVRDWLAEGGQLTVPPPPTAAEVAAMVAAAKIKAKQAVADRADAIAGVITGIVPLSERLSWGTKVEAARAVLGQSATAGQLNFLSAEASLLKNADGSQMTAAQLAAIIVTKSDRYMTASGMIAGLRQQTMAAIDALTNPATLAADLAAINAAAETQAQALLAQLNATP